MNKKTNITLRLDAELLSAAKSLATKRRISLQAMLVEMLAETVKKNDNYERSMKRAIARMKEGWELGWKKPKSRDESHERL